MSVRERAGAFLSRKPSGARALATVWAAAAVSAAVLAGASVASASTPCPSLGGEGHAAPILSAHLSADGATSLVVELDGHAGCEGALQVVFLELAAPRPSSEDQASWGVDAWKRRLVGSRVVAKELARPGETLGLGLPAELFGSVYGLGVAVIADSPDGDRSKFMGFTSVALPPQDPADPLLAPPALGAVVVTEFMKDPMAVSDQRGEWLELQNRTGVAVDLEGWTLRDDGSNRTVIVAEAPGAGVIVPAGGFIVLGRSADAALNGGVQVDAVYSGFTLSNGDDEIILEAPGGFLVDRVDYLDAGDGGWPGVSGASVALSPRFIGTTVAADGASWCSGTEPLPFGDLGSPGAENADC